MKRKKEEASWKLAFISASWLGMQNERLPHPSATILSPPLWIITLFKLWAKTILVPYVLPLGISLHHQQKQYNQQSTRCSTYLPLTEVQTLSFCPPRKYKFCYYCCLCLVVNLTQARRMHLSWGIGCIRLAFESVGHFLGKFQSTMLGQVVLGHLRMQTEQSMRASLSSSTVCVCSHLGFLPWVPALASLSDELKTVRWNKSISPQVDFGHGVYHSIGNLINTSVVCIWDWPF